MPLRSADEFLASLRDGRHVVYRGERVEDVTAHPHLGRGARHVAIDFRLAHARPGDDLLTVPAPDGEPMSRYFAVPRTGADLLRRRDLIEHVTREARSFVPLIKEIGTDAMFALMIIAGRVDREAGTGYAKRVRAFYEHCRDGDLAMAVAQTDAKGDRAKRPSEQAEPDAYVHRVRETRDGLVVRGVKAHTTNAVFANEILVVPTRAMGEGDADYAVAFAVPADAPGLTMVASARGFNTTSAFDNPLSSRYSMTESLTIFDDVLVPWERVFLCGERRAAGPLARTFVEFHRFTAVSYKTPLLELLLGGAALVADYHGLLGAAHVREKLARLTLYLQTTRGLGTAAAAGARDVDGIAVPDVALTNAAKYYFARGYHDAVRDVQDLAGGLLVTGPMQEDWETPAVRRLFEGALGGREGIRAEDRLRVINLLRDLVASDLGGYLEVLAIHAEGSLETQKLTVLQDADIERVKRLAAAAAGVNAQQ
ncbi:MAG TPA: 4-hydroxyphenylacetate 3-hydroxylase N-terminal domain-containing protein [bacterium]|nr:4-hydroxyphenylacetate 3-hydroxylase N-terminal domain-containing protein [bacterium]